MNHVLKNYVTSKSLSTPNRLARLTDKNILNFTLILIILKPLFDLDWRWPIFHINSIPIPFHQIIAAFVPFIITIVLILRLATQRILRINNNIFAIIFLILITITLFLELDINSLSEYMRIYSFFIIFLSVPILISDEEEFYKISKLSIYISLIPTFLSYLQVFRVLPFTEYDYLPEIGKIGRISGGYLHPTGYLNYLLILIPLSIYLNANKKLSNKFFWCWLIFILIMVARSFHRSSVIIICLVLGIYICFSRRSWFKYILIFFFLISLCIFSPYLWRFLNQGGALTGFQFRGRNEIWSMYLKYFQNSSFSKMIFGFGSPKLPNGMYEPHSDWLRLLFNYGFLGIFSYFFFLFSIGCTFLIRFLKIKKDQLIMSGDLLGLVIVLIIILYSITMEPLRYSSFSWLAALVLGYLYRKGTKVLKFRI